jgi:hypothetical protein
MEVRGLLSNNLNQYAMCSVIELINHSSIDTVWCVCVCCGVVLRMRPKLVYLCVGWSPIASPHH